MAVEKKANEKNGEGRKAEVQNRKNNNMKSNFSRAANIFVRNFFYARWIYFWTNFIGIIWLDNLLMLVKVTSVYYSGGCASRTPPWGHQPQDPAPPFISEHVRLGISHNKTARGWGKGVFYFSALFPNHFSQMPKKYLV